MQTTTVKGIRYRKLQKGERIKETDRFLWYVEGNIRGVQTPAAYCIGEVIGSIRVLDSYYRPIPEPETLNFKGTCYRLLEGHEIVKHNDYAQHTDREYDPVRPTVAIGKPAGSFETCIFWRESAHYLDPDTGRLWYRLHQGTKIEKGDRTGIDKPSDNEPQGNRVRKSRHVWRTPLKVTDYEDRPDGVSMSAIWNSVGSTKIERDKLANVLRYGLYADTKIKAPLHLWDVEDPDSHTDKDGRPWRRLPVGTKLRKCDWYGMGTKHASAVAPYIVGGVSVHSGFWRPAGPPVLSAEKTKEVSPPNEHFMKTLKTYKVTVNGYSFEDLVRYLESDKCE